MLECFLVQELIKTVPFLDLQQLPLKHGCGTKDMLVSILGLLSKGGVYLGEKVILARLPPQLGNRTTWLASGLKDALNVTLAVMLAEHSYSDRRLNIITVDAFSGKWSAFVCFDCFCCC